MPVTRPGGRDIRDGSVTDVDVAMFVDSETPVGVIDGRNLVFTLASIPSSGLKLHLRGSLLRTPADYTLSGLTITFNSRQTPRPGDDLVAEYRI